MLSPVMKTQSTNPQLKFISQLSFIIPKCHKKNENNDSCVVPRLQNNYIENQSESYVGGESLVA